MKKLFFLFLTILIFVPFISSESIGEFKVNDEMQITNYCGTGDCTYITLQSLEYPNGTIVYINTNMTKNGQAYNYSFTPSQVGEYFFVTCGDATIDVCERDNFLVNFNGEEFSTPLIITLLGFFILLFMGYTYLNNRIDYDKWYDKIYQKYQHRNFIKAGFSIIGYNIVKNKFSNYYFIIFPILIILSEMVLTYRINILATLFENLVFVYSWGILLVALTFFGSFQEIIVRLIKDATNESWGIQDD